jgi:hypothetical protein
MEKEQNPKRKRKHKLELELENSLLKQKLDMIRSIVEVKEEERQSFVGNQKKEDDIK